MGQGLRDDTDPGLEGGHIVWVVAWKGHCTRGPEGGRLIPGPLFNTWPITEGDG